MIDETAGFGAGSDLPALGRIGLCPEVGINWQLTRALGYRRRSASHLRAPPVGEEAFARGLGKRGWSHDEPLASERWCGHVRELPTHVVAITKALVRLGPDLR